jgi:hypothetical protein
VKSDLVVIASNIVADVQSDIASLASDIITTTNSDIVVIQSDLTIHLTQRGTEFSITKAITDKTTIATAGLLLTGASSGGELILKRFTLQNDSTVTGGNTGGALIYSDDATYPLNAVLTAGVFAASGFLAADIGYPIQVGKKVGIKAVTGDCTGAGALIITMTFVRNANGATIAAV